MDMAQEERNLPPRFRSAPLLYMSCNSLVIIKLRESGMFLSLILEPSPTSKSQMIRVPEEIGLQAIALVIQGYYHKLGDLILTKSEVQAVPKAIKLLKSHLSDVIGAPIALELEKELVDKLKPNGPNAHEVFDLTFHWKDYEPLKMVNEEALKIVLRQLSYYFEGGSGMTKLMEWSADLWLEVLMADRIPPPGPINEKDFIMALGRWGEHDPKNRKKVTEDLARTGLRLAPLTPLLQEALWTSSLFKDAHEKAQFIEDVNSKRCGQMPPRELEVESPSLKSPMDQPVRPQIPSVSSQSDSVPRLGESVDSDWQGTTPAGSSAGSSTSTTAMFNVDASESTSGVASSASSRDVIPPPPNPSGKVPCKVCGKEYSAKYLEDHEGTHNDPQFECNACGKRFKQRRSLRHHECGCLQKQVQELDPDWDDGRPARKKKAV